MLKPEVSLPTGLAVAAIVYGIHSNMTPTIADIRHNEPGDPNISSSRKAATWTSAAVVGGISLMTKDPTIFVVGSFMVIAMDFLTRHANLVNPLTGTATVRAAKDRAQAAGYTIGDEIHAAAGDYVPA